MTFTVMLAALGLMWLDSWRRIFTLWVVPVWAGFVAYSRVLLEVHTPIDVIAATLVGSVLGMVAVAAIVRLAGHPPSG
jgi:membrane-associated phospholipid phosphatase